MKIEIIKVRLIFTEPLLGTACNNPDVHEEFIASKAPTQQLSDEELAALDPAAEIEKAKTVFLRTDEKPCLFDYQVRGFFKEIFGILIGLGEIPAGQCSHNGRKEAVDHRLFIKPRRIPIAGSLDDFTRPIRMETMKGPRVALVTSERLTNAVCEFSVELLTGLPTEGKKKANYFTADDVREALNYGERVGLGQWRGSGGFGRFTWQELT